MTMTDVTEDRGPRGRSLLVFTVIGWAASLVGYLVAREIIKAVGPATGWFNVLLALVVPILSALAGTLVMPPAALRGAKGALLHALVVLPVPIAFNLFSMFGPFSEFVTGMLIVFLVGVISVGTLIGAVLGRLLRRDPDRLLRDSF